MKLYNLYTAEKQDKELWEIVMALDVWYYKKLSSSQFRASEGERSRLKENVWHGTINPSYTVASPNIGYTKSVNFSCSEDLTMHKTAYLQAKLWSKFNTMGFTKYHPQQKEAYNNVFHHFAAGNILPTLKTTLLWHDHFICRALHYFF